MILTNAVGFKAAACLVLYEAGHRLHYTDITELVLESGHLKTRGRPAQHYACPALRERAAIHRASFL